MFLSLHISFAKKTTKTWRQPVLWTVHTSCTRVFGEAKWQCSCISKPSLKAKWLQKLLEWAEFVQWHLLDRSGLSGCYLCHLSKPVAWKLLFARCSACSVLTSWWRGCHCMRHWKVLSCRRVVGGFGRWEASQPAGLSALSLVSIPAGHSGVSDCSNLEPSLKWTIGLPARIRQRTDDVLITGAKKQEALFFLLLNELLDVLNLQINRDELWSFVTL